MLKSFDMIHYNAPISEMPSWISGAASKYGCGIVYCGLCSECSFRRLFFTILFILMVKILPICCEGFVLKGGCTLLRIQAFHGSSQSFVSCVQGVNHSHC